MCTKFDVMHAYHRKIAIHEEKTGESFPLIRPSCVDEDERTITTTHAFAPEIVARWRQDSYGRIRINLVGATR